MGSQMVNWTDMKQTLARGLTEHFGETIRHTPCIKINVNAGATFQDQLAYELRGIFDDPLEHVDLDKKGAKGGHRYTEHTTVASFVSFEDCDLKHPITQGDKIELLERGETYEVRDVCREMDGRTKAKLLIIGRHKPA